MTIYKQIIDLLEDREGCIVTLSEIKKQLFEKHATNPSSIILSDYCYNRINDGILFNKHIFEYMGEGTYKYLGEMYPYTGKIVHKPLGQKDEIVVGEWQHGTKIIYSKG